jgi:PmbA protein
VRVHSNGFTGERLDTAFWVSGQVSVKDPDGRRPEEYDFAGVRFLSELPAASAVGRRAAERTLSRIGAKKPESGVFSMVLENRAAGRLLSALTAALSAQALQQKRSFLEGKLGQEVGGARLTLTDDPFVAKGFGSRLFDGEGMAAKPLPIFEKGVLRHYYVDTYYGKKLQMAPTTGGSSNLRLALGDQDQAALLSDVAEGILVTGFLGGNSNATTGDFSLGVQGFRIRGGKAAEAVSELNISGNHLDFWKRLAAVGNDPWPYSTLLTPTLVFEGVQFAGV